MLTLIGVLLAIWLVFVLLGIIIKGLVWLLILGIALFVVTSAVGWVKRETLSRR